MGFTESIRTCLREKFITFSGRASRSEYWYFVLFYFLVFVGSMLAMFMVGSLDAFMDGDVSSMFSGFSAIIPIALVLFGLGIIIPGIAVLVRRFHDVGLSGWWYLASILVSVIPVIGEAAGGIASIAVFVITLLKGTTGANKYGPDPLVEQSTADVFA